MANGPIFAVAGAADDDGRRDVEAVSGSGRTADMLDVVVGLDQQINALTALRTRAIDLARRESEASRKPGASPMLEERAFRAELATALRVSERGAENLIGNARALVECLPATMRVFEAGTVSYRHALVLVGELSGLDADSQAALDRTLAQKAGSLTSSRLQAVARIARERLNPESIQARQVTARETRGVAVDDLRDGMSTLSVELPGPQAHAIFNRLTTAAKALKVPGDIRTLDQRRADILTAVLLATEGAVPFGVIPGEDDSDRFVAWFRGITAEVVVSVPVLTLLGHSDVPATMDGTVPIDPETARILVGGAGSLVRILTHPETGATLSVGRKRYKVPKDLRMYLKIRDLACRFPGCFQPAARCDIDHTMDWQYSGNTEHVNLAHLCRGHHTLKGQTGWNVTQTPDGTGTLNWESPTGRKYTTTPGS